MTTMHLEFCNHMLRLRYNKKVRWSSCIKQINIRSRYEHKLTGVTIVHKRTGEVTAIPDIDLRTVGLWSRMGWFKLPNGLDQYVVATTKSGEIYKVTKYPSSPGLAMPGSAYTINGKLERK